LHSFGSTKRIFSLLVFYVLPAGIPVVPLRAIAIVLNLKEGGEPGGGVKGEAQLHAGLLL
jgi:hypothetical protein